MTCINSTDNKLYYNLINLCDNEEQAKDLFARIMNPDFLQDYEIKTDKDGVPSFKDVYKKAKLRQHLKDEKIIHSLERDLNPKTLNATTSNINQLSDEVTMFNNNNEISDFVAVIERNGEQISSKVVHKNYKTDILAKQIKTNSDLNSYLQNKLAEVGISVGAVTELERRRGIAGVTDFELAKDATKGTVELIRIAKGQKGAEALPEEFSHFALEAVGEENPLVNRLYNSISDEIVEAVLGESFDRYYEEYNGNMTDLRKEVAGKLLAEYIKSEYTGNSSILLKRVFDVIKDKFVQLDETSLRAALIDLDATLKETTKKILFSNLLKEVGLSKLRFGNKEYYNLDINNQDMTPDDYEEMQRLMKAEFGDDNDTGPSFPNDFLSEEQKAKNERKKTNDEYPFEVVDESVNEVINESVNEVINEGVNVVDEGVNEVIDEGVNKPKFYDEGEEFDESFDKDFEEPEIEDDFDINISIDERVDEGFEGMEKRNKATEHNRIDVKKLEKDFIEDINNLKEELKQEGEFEDVSKLFLNIESSLTKLNLLNRKKGFVFKDFENKEAMKEYLYKYKKNMLGNLLYFIHGSIKNLHSAWEMYESNPEENRQCDNLLIFKNTISALEYVLNTTDMQNVMDVLSMEFSSESDTKIRDVIQKYVKDLSYHLKQAQQFVQNEELLLTKSILSDKFGDKFEIPMTLADSQTLTLEGELSNGTQQDVSVLTRFFSSMANSPSLILKMVDQIVKKSNDKRRNKVFDLKRKIVALGTQYVKDTGSDDFSFLYHKDKDGNRTGYYIDETDYARYDKMYKKMVLDKKDKWMPKGKFDKDSYIYYIKKFESYMKSHNNFHNKEWDKLTSKQQEFAKEFLEIKKQLDDHMFYEMETIYDSDFAEEVGVPESDIDAVYDDEAKSGDWIAQKKEKQRQFRKNKRAAKTIKIEKSLINKLKSAKDIKGVKDELQRAFKEMFTKKSSDVELTENDKTYLTDFKGKRVYDIPRLFTSMQEGESEENMSLDAISTLVAYSDAAENRFEKMQIVSLIEIIQDVVNKRQVAETKGSKIMKRALETNFGKFVLPVAFNGDESNISKMLKDYMESQIYGMWNVDMGTFGDTNISKDKVGNMLLSQTALTGMALNVLGGISNVETGKAMMRIESICGQFFNVKDVAKADVEYTKNIGACIAEAGSLVKNNKMAVFIEQFNVLQEYEQSVLHTEFDSNNFVRCCSEQGLFILNNLGEHFLQTRTALSVAMATKVKDKDGKEISLWDAMELRDLDPDHPEYGKKIFLKEGVTKLDGSEIEDIQEYFDKYTHRVQAINQRMHGIYNYEDRCAAQRYMAGRFFYQFRKYIPVSIQRRFGQAQINFDLDTPTEGYYRTFGKFWKKVYKEMKEKRGGIATVWKSMNKWERQNCVRSIVELSQTLLIFAATITLEAAMGDKKKQSPWVVKMLHYQMRRLYSELASFTPSTGMLNEALKLVDSPAAGIRIMDKNIEFLETIKPWNWFGENAIIEQGKWKGHSKGYKALMQAIPVYNSWLNVFDPYEATKFYTK